MLLENGSTLQLILSTSKRMTLNWYVTITAASQGVVPCMSALTVDLYYLCVCAPGLQVTLIYATGRYLNAFNTTSQRLGVFNGDSSSIIESLDVDSTKSIVYWVDGEKMRRVAMPTTLTDVIKAEELCAVNQANGIAVDWITG